MADKRRTVPVGIVTAIKRHRGELTQVEIESATSTTLAGHERLLARLA